jgi:glucosamine 6-phosphate synthetase-like amidotransferase/phosphosugar isomerase protein
VTPVSGRPDPGRGKHQEMAQQPQILARIAACGRRTDRFGDRLLIALSQSARTPEIVAVDDRFHEVGARAGSVTNDPASDLARMADLNIDADFARNPMPATKTVTGQMLACLVIASAVRPTLRPLRKPLGSLTPWRPSSTTTRWSESSHPAA